MLSALDWLFNREQYTDALYLAGALAEFWIFWGLIVEGRTRLEELMRAARAAGVAARGLTYTSAARLAWIQDDFEQATSLYEEALAAYRDEGNARGEAVTLNNLGTVAHLQTDYARATAYYEQAVERGRTGDWPLTLAMPLGNWAPSPCSRAISFRLPRSLDEAFDLYREAGDTQRMAITISNLGVWPSAPVNTRRQPARPRGARYEARHRRQALGGHLSG